MNQSQRREMIDVLSELRAAAYAMRYDGRIDDIRRISDALCMEASRVRPRRSWWARFKRWFRGFFLFSDTGGDI